MQRTHRTQLARAAAHCLPALAALCLLGPAPGAAQQRVQRSVPADAAGALRIHVPAGRVSVIGWSRDSIAVSGTVPTRGDSVQLRAGAGSAKLWLEGAGAEPAAVLEVRVPSRTRVWIRTATADVVVRALEGGVDVVTVSGAVDLRGEPAEASLESMGGRLVAEVRTRRLRARTAGGDIEIRGFVEDAQAYTVSGRIEILNKQVGRGRFESVDGGIRYRGGVAPGSSVEFITHGGDVVAAFPAQLDAEIRISSYEGRIDNQLGGRLTQPAGGSRRDRLLVVGDGAAEVVIRTFRGTITLQRM